MLKHLTSSVNQCIFTDATFKISGNSGKAFNVILLKVVILAYIIEYRSNVISNQAKNSKKQKPTKLQ